MKSIHKKSLTAVSASALAAGIAHGGIVYTYYNQTVIAGGNEDFSFDLNQDGTNDFLIEFDNNNALKPYVSDSPSDTSLTLTYVLANDSSGLPLTTNGTLIDINYQTAEETGYFWQDANQNVQGGWDSGGTNIQGYVGLELTDAGGTNHWGWAQFIYNSQTVLEGVAGTLTIVDAAMETGTNGIYTGQTAESNTAPAIVVAPPSQTNNIGGTTQFKVVATGNPTPGYQWKAGAVGSGVYTNLTDGGGISGSLTSVLTISNLADANAADYVAVVSNADGSVTTTSATLTVVPSLVIGLSPSPAEIYTGGPASITVNYASSVADQFTWLKNGSPLSNGGNISGADTATLVISSTSSSDAANYSVILSNQFGAITSAVDPLILQTPASIYQQAVAMFHPVCYYSFNETNDPAQGNAIAFDYVGGLNGTYGTQVENGNSKSNIPGPRPSDGFPGFSSNNSSILIGSTPHDESCFVDVPPPNLNANTATILAWVYPTEVEPSYSVMITYRTPVAGTANGLNISGSGNGNLGYHWNDAGGSYGYVSGLIPPADQWSFVALVVEPTNSYFYLFNTTGVQTSTNAFDAIVQAFNTPGHIGGDSVDGNWVGQLDEIALFNHALSSNEVGEIYNAAALGTLPIQPPPPQVTLNIQPSGSSLVLTWSQGALLQASSVTGPWTTTTATSPYTVSATGAQQFYKVKVE